MTSTPRILASLVLISFSYLFVLAQTERPGNDRFAADRLSFEYPAGWSIKDESTLTYQQLTLTRRGTSVQVIIIVKRDLTLRDDLKAALERFPEPLIEKALLVVGKGKTSPVRLPIKRTVGSLEAEGIHLQTSDQNRAETAEVIWLRTRLSMVGLMFTRKNSEESMGSKLWETIRTTLRVDPPVIVRTKSNTDASNPNKGIEALNGYALNLVQPQYPIVARAAQASGEVRVQITIDELGNVIAAHAVSGHPLLLAACVEAARQSKFLPTKLEGEPVRVAGVITYNFVAQ